MEIKKQPAVFKIFYIRSELFLTKYVITPQL